jgi:WD40 repeat protein
MDFSEVFKFNTQCSFSPNGRYLANITNFQLVIKDVETLQIIQLYTCCDEISRIEWSFDSQYILCCINKRACVQVFSVSDSKWACKIDEGAAGVSFARFSPDGRHIITCADFQLRLTIWSLMNKFGHVAYIMYPKFSSKGLDFTRDGKYMALAERRDCKDFISIIVTDTWELVKHFSVCTRDLADLKWSPNGRVLCVWESSLEYKVVIYSPDGTMIKSYSAYEDALGIKTIQWSPSSQLLAIGSYDGKARILNNLTWKVITDFSHDTQITNPNIYIYREVEYNTKSQSTAVIAKPTTTRYVLSQVPVYLKTTRVDFNRINPKIGVGVLEWSYDGKYLCTRNDNMSNVLWIWEIATLNPVAIIINLTPIKCVQWDPKQLRLAYCGGEGRIYIWSPDGCSCVDVPIVNFRVHSFKWNNDGTALLLMDQNLFCCCYPHHE